MSNAHGAHGARNFSIKSGFHFCGIEIEVIIVILTGFFDSEGFCHQRISGGYSELKPIK